MKSQNSRFLRFLASTLTVCLVASSLSFVSAQESASTTTFMSYNTHNCIGLDGKTDYERVAKVILAENADVVALQELDYKTTRSKGVDVLEALAQSTKMHASFGPAIDYQGGKYGIGVLSKEKPVNVAYYPLPGKEEKRCLLVVEFEKYVFCCSHWSLTKADRDATVKIIAEKMKEQKKMTFVSGDFNAEPESSSIQELKKDWTILSADAFTFPADGPSVRIDYICGADPTGKRDATRLSKSVADAFVASESVASDHRPIVVKVFNSIFD